MSLALKLALSPVLVAQGVYTRLRTPRLPEATGPRSGVVGSGPMLRLLVLGDSSAAGVGVGLQRDALAGPLARALARQSHLQVHWQLLARTGLTLLVNGRWVQSRALGYAVDEAEAHAGLGRGGRGSGGARGACRRGRTCPDRRGRRGPRRKRRLALP